MSAPTRKDIALVTDLYSWDVWFAARVVRERFYCSFTCLEVFFRKCHYSPPELLAEGHPLHLGLAWLWNPIHFWIFPNQFLCGGIRFSLFRHLCPVFPDASIASVFLASYRKYIIHLRMSHAPIRSLGPCVAARRCWFRFESPFSIMIKSPPKKQISLFGEDQPRLKVGSLKLSYLR